MLLMLLVQVRHRKQKTKDLIVFAHMCIFDLLLCFANVYLCLFALFYTKITSGWASALAVISSTISGILDLSVAVFWLLFVEYVLYQSRDIVWRRFPFIMIPYYVGVMISILVVAVPINSFSQIITLLAGSILGRVILFICGVYIVSTYIALYRMGKRKKIPQQMRVTPTVLSFLLGLILTALTPYRLEAFGYAVGLMFADYYMFRHLRFVDAKTGFYNEKYLPTLREEALKKDIRHAMVIRFRTSGDRDKLAEILKYWEPEHSKIVLKDDGEFLLLSEIKKTFLAERFISLVKDHCEKEGIRIEASYEMIQN